MEMFTTSAGGVGAFSESKTENIDETSHWQYFISYQCFIFNNVLFLKQKGVFSMNSKFNPIIFTFAMVLVFSVIACTRGDGGKIFNSAEALKEYLDKQPTNNPDKPIKVIMNANATMLEKIAAVINSAGKYVILNLSGNILTAIPDYAFFDKDKEIGCATLTAITIPDSITSIEDGVFLGCTSLTSITIPTSVTSIGEYAFAGCNSLTSVRFEGTITSGMIHSFAFGERSYLPEKYLTGGIGTYTRPRGSNTWTKQ
jgi:hypothetical protein